MSEIKVDSIGPRVDSGTLTIGAAGDTVNIAGTAGTGFPASGAALTGSTNNTVVTVTGTNAIQGEANLTFDGTDLDVGASCKISSNGAIANFSNHNGSATETTLATSDGNEKVRCFNDGKVTFETGGSERMRITSGGIVGVGANGSSADLGVGIHIKSADSGASVSANGDELVIEGSGNSGMTIASGSSSEGTIKFADSGSAAAGYIHYSHSLPGYYFGVEGADQITVKSNRVGIGTASPADSRLHVKTPNQGCIRTERTGTANSGHINFYNPNGMVGEIVTNGSATSYLTSSDYRLKENVDYNFDATTRLKQLKPARFNFKADADTTVDGFIAHEVSSVIPEAISGVKDATETKQKVVLNSSGSLFADNIEEEDWTQGKTDGVYENDTTWESSKVFPIHQGIDQSKLVPLLVKSLQEALAEIDTLKTKVIALENA